ncbi:MAG: bifunctional pyr operon transcriptional regulator/uracil phosphoribosyltransferase PyrR [Tenericutes bacterium HGW-Tenericutes-1]|jgi:pyrimidine operon attenuation protein/uracil phosphoribosyltransferase|nr:MAG: bifunctional pyr operon transcriptional regulator/uracil phosphoribosyltransferase PyrR [Tenericutes bacterium HGW-Tenericutes-1]
MPLVINQETIQKTLRRITHEIIEKTDDLSTVLLIGIKNKGVPIAKMIQENIKTYTNTSVEMVELDISMHRDDDKKKPTQPIQIDVNGKICILIDDVLYTGRTVRAAMDAIVEFGRPKKIELVVLIDRGHRELPIRADYVGKNMPTAKDEIVRVQMVGSEAGVYIEKKGTDYGKTN